MAANLLDRQFTAPAPNQRWVGDTTEFVIGESGKLYLAAINADGTGAELVWRIKKNLRRARKIPRLEAGVDQLEGEVCHAFSGKCREDHR